MFVTGLLYGSPLLLLITLSLLNDVCSLKSEPLGLVYHVMVGFGEPEAKQSKVVPCVFKNFITFGGSKRNTGSPNELEDINLS